MIRRASLALALVLACAAGADAAPAVVSASAVSSGGTGNSTITLGGAPANGDIVSVMVFTSLSAGAPTSITDSNAVALTQRLAFSGAATNEYIYDYTVSGSPTQTYNCTINLASSCGQAVAIDVSGAPGTPTYYSNAGPGTTPSVVLSGGVSTDVAFCGTKNGLTNETVSMTNAGTVTTIGAGTSNSFGYALATGAPTCNGSASATNWVMAGAIYTATAAAGHKNLLLTGVGYDPFSVARLSGVL
jgi:hypothetical protein